MLVSDLIKSGLRKIGAISTGEIPASYTDSLLALQVMLRSWAQKKMLVFASTRESFNTVPSQSLYTWGASGNITTIRPHQILGAFVRDTNGTDIPIGIISEGEYNSLPNKGTAGRPAFLFYHPKYPQGNVYLYPTPQEAETIWIDSLKPFTETSSFSSETDTIVFPPNYEEAIVYNFAIRVAPEFGITVPDEVAAIANTSYTSVMALNASNAVEPISSAVPAGNMYGRGYRYNINSGI